MARASQDLRARREAVVNTPIEAQVVNHDVAAALAESLELDPMRFLAVD